MAHDRIPASAAGPDGFCEVIHGVLRGLFRQEETLRASDEDTESTDGGYGIHACLQLLRGHPWAKETVVPMAGALEARRPFW
ncbi:hypothetical protein ACX80L_16515 [Arthrobacter sp. MDT1-48-3]